MPNFPKVTRQLAAIVVGFSLSTVVFATPLDSPEESSILVDPQTVLTKIENVGHTVALQASDLVGNALELLGVRYRRGGNSAESGFDCSGFVKSVYAQTLGLILPRKAEQQAAATQKIEKSELQPGDLVFFNTMRRAFSHVGMYIGDGKFVHSPKPGQAVRVENMDQSYWQQRFNGARRVFSSALDTTTLSVNRSTASNER